MIQTAGTVIVIKPSSDHCIAPSDPFFSVMPSQPTQSAADWGNIQMLASRLSFQVTLEWPLTPDLQAPGEAGPTHTLGDDYWPLINKLTTLLYKLLAGHMLDAKLDMQKMHTAALMTVMMA